MFGWEYLDTGPDFGHYHMAQLRGLNAAGIGPMQPGQEMPSAWTIYFSSDDAAADVSRVQGLGGQIFSDVMEVGDSGKMAICADPTGAVFGLWQANQHIGMGIEAEAGAMSWSEVNTRDSAAALAFYTALFNLSSEKLEDRDYFILQRGGEHVCGILQMDENWEGIPPHWMGYFGVDDTDAAVERATAAGGSLRVPAFDTPYGRIAVLGDPFGAVFIVVDVTTE
ncbi:MAG: VOC family protein [Caldilineaceae bacterium]|nr:VOC family protein [Caldilineaceae bacterium]